MHISRTPLRISLGGGGTDLPSYYEQRGEGFLVAAAIDKYVYVATHDNFVDRYLLKYSKIEDAENLEDIENPIFREALRLAKVRPGVEITSIADIPAGTGLGSSGSFAVGLLKALYAREHVQVSNSELARQACYLEIDRLKEPVGKQDQYIAALGGLTSLRFTADQVVAESISMDSVDRKTLDESLLLFYTGIRRSASDELMALDAGASGDDVEIRRNLDQVLELGYKARDLLQSGELEEFGLNLSAQWKMKYDRSPSRVHHDLDSLIQEGLAAGATGGKLVGAGGGGFLLFFAERKAELRKVMRNAGLREVDFKFDYVGTTVISA